MALAIKLVCLAGQRQKEAKALQEAHPDVDIFTAALDDHLNVNIHIAPGLEMQARLFGIK